MYLKIQHDASFYLFLTEIDREIAQNARSNRCECGGKLDEASYYRKPRNLPKGVVDEVTKRFSFCCRQDGCRKRLTPPSVRFAGRKVWLAAFILFASKGGATQSRIDICDLMGIPPKTFRRWLLWWHEQFANSRFWRVHCAGFRLIFNNDSLPYNLYSYFITKNRNPCTGFLQYLKFISPGWDNNRGNFVT